MFKQFQQLKTQLSQVETWLEPEAVQQFKLELAERQANQKPRVMVYGIYNAGKSSLINALSGKPVAKIGDIPVTDGIDEYQIGDIVIIDTPGIDAPIEHEQIAREQLAKSDAVIFVVGVDSSLEEECTYQEIGKILNAGKPMIVVLSNKAAYAPTESEYLYARDKFRTNLRQYFAQDATLLARLDQVADFLVDSKTALEAKQTQDNELLELSCLEDLAKAIERLFKQTTSAHIAVTLATQLQKLITQAIEQHQQQNSDNSLSQTQQLLAQLQTNQNQIMQHLMARLLGTKPELKQQLLTQALAGDGELTPTLEQWLARHNQYAQNYIAGELEGISLKIEQVDAIHLEVNHASICIPTTEPALEQNNALNQLTQTVLMHPEVQAGLAKGVELAIQQLKNWLPSVFNKIGAKTIATTAGKATVVFGPLIDILMATVEFYQGNQKVEQQIAQERQRRENMRLQINSLVEEVLENYQLVLKQHVNQIFIPMLNEVQQRLEKLDAQAAANSKVVFALIEAQSQLQSDFQMQ